MTARRKEKPAGPQELWNIYKFPEGKQLAKAATSNGKLRRRYLAMRRASETFYDNVTAAEAIDARAIAHHFGALEACLDELWDDLERAGIVYD